MKKQAALFLLSLSVFSTAVFAQPSLSRLQSKLSKADAPQGIDFRLLTTTQAGMFFKDNVNIPETQAEQWLGGQLELRQNVDVLAFEKVTTTGGNLSVKTLHQYYRGIKVEHGVANIMSKNGQIRTMQLEYYAIPERFNSSPTVSEQLALKNALVSTGARRYDWGLFSDFTTATNLPRGELVIIKDYDSADAVCLAYKFEIVALQPASAANVYVNAHTGKIVLTNSLIKHLRSNTGAVESSYEKQFEQPLERIEQPVNLSDWLLSPVTADNNQSPQAPLAYANTPGLADTRTNGRHTIYTDNQNANAAKPYRLRATRNQQDIVTLDLQQQPWNGFPDQYPLAKEFEDNDNNWTSAEHRNQYKDDAALDVHFNMQIVSDYWLNVHQRKGWNNANGPIKSYVHATEFDANGTRQWLPNAFWFKGRMTFGDGNSPSTTIEPYTSLDISAHEMGHAITEATCDLIYNWESGALNEGMSDIWSACITHYAVVPYLLNGESDWRIGEKVEHPGTTGAGFRDMSNPAIFGTPPYPSAYKNANWRAASLQTCRVPTDANDKCGVHFNSSVLNKWFFLITDGQSGTNSFGTAYNVAGLGFTKSEKIAYLLTLNLTPNASFATAKNVSLNATAGLYGINSSEYAAVKEAWRAVAVDSNIHNMGNTPVFTTNNFSSVAVGKDGVVLAGTSYNGMYKFQNESWTKLTEMPDVKINDIKADYQGDFWIAQSGRSGTQSGGSSIAGGVNYLKSPFDAASTLYTIGAQTDLPSRNARCMYVDTFRYNEGIRPRVWVATTAYITSSQSTSGMLGQGLNTTGRPFASVNANINIASGTAGCLTMSGNKEMIWTFVQANNGINQLLVYDAVTSTFIASYDHNSHPIIPANFVARSIYCDVRGRVWIGLAAGGILVCDENRAFHYIDPVNYAAIFPPGTQANFNAMAGTKDADVYIGTTQGLVFFERGDGLISRIDQASSYRVYGRANGLPSANINAIAYDTSRFKVLVATDSGIVFWEPLCISPYCFPYKSSANVDAESIASGNWSNPATWNNNKVPDSLTKVVLKHNVTVDIVNAVCQSLSVVTPAAITIQTGKNLTIYQEASDVIMTEQRRRRER